MLLKVGGKNLIKTKCSDCFLIFKKDKKKRELTLTGVVFLSGFIFHSVKLNVFKAAESEARPPIQAEIYLNTLQSAKRK